MNTKHKITPLGDKVLVKPVSGEEGKKTKSGIIIPETIDKEKPEQGKVIAVGEGRHEDGKIINLNAEEIFRNIHKDFDEKIIFTISDREKPLIGGIKDIRIIRM